jgi:hypothetical protein
MFAHCIRVAKHPDVICEGWAKMINYGMFQISAELYYEFALKPNMKYK